MTSLFDAPGVSLLDIMSMTVAVCQTPRQNDQLQGGNIGFNQTTV